MTLRDGLVIKLETENEELRERVRILEDMLGMTFDAPLQLGLTEKEAKVLGLLTKVDMATKDAIMFHIYADRPNEVPEIKVVDVFVCKVRQKLKPYDISIQTIWGRGYRLTTQDKAKLEELRSSVGFL